MGEIYNGIVRSSMFSGEAKLMIEEGLVVDAASYTAPRKAAKR